MRPLWLKRCLLRAGAAVLIVFLVGCAAGISRDDLLMQMQQGSSPLIVDVRSQGEYDRDHIPGAVHLPFYSVGAALAGLNLPKDSAVVLYCEHGPRSGMAGFSLYLSGYRKIYSLDGHMKGWRQNEFPIEKITP